MNAERKIDTTQSMDPTAIRSIEEFNFCSGGMGPSRPVKMAYPTESPVLMDRASRQFPSAPGVFRVNSHTGFHKRPKPERRHYFSGFITCCKAVGPYAISKSCCNCATGDFRTKPG